MVRKKEHENEGVVFFVGAGFTKAICDTAPTGKDFLVSAFRHIWRLQPEPRIAELHKFLEDVFHPLGEESGYPKIEDVLSLLDYCVQDNAPLGREYPVDKLCELRREFVFLIGRLIEESIEFRRSNLKLSRDFVQKIVDSGRQASIVSTNYDIVLDNALLFKARSCNYGMLLRYNVLLQHSFRNRGNNKSHEWYLTDFDKEHEAGEINSGDIPLLKPHGSLNWAYCPKCDEIDITVGFKGNPSPLIATGKAPICVNNFCTSPYEPFLVTPTMFKAYSSRPLKTLLQVCRQKIATAHKLVFIGYSLPDADYHLRSLLATAIAQNLDRQSMEIVVIDKETKKPPDKEDEERILQLRERYFSLFGDRVRFQPVGLQGLLGDFRGILRI